MKTNQLFLRDKVCGAFLGVAIGDVRDMPFETMRRSQILQATDWQGVNKYYDAIRNTLRDTQGFKSGQATDDWQLTKAVARSIALKRDYNLTCSFLAQCEEFRRCTLGWGGTTKNSMKDIELYFFTKGARGRDPAVPATTESGAGVGNGVAIKIMPIALIAALRQWSSGKLLETVMAEGLATHADKRASIAAYAVAWLAVSVVREDLVSDDQSMKRKWQRLIRAVRAAERIYEVPSNDNNVSAKLEKIHTEGWWRDEHVLREECGTACVCWESVPFSIATFLRHPHDFSLVVKEAIEAGGDTDSNASMAGGLVGAHLGMEAIPKSMLQLPFEAEPVIALADEFCDAVM